VNDIEDVVAIYFTILSQDRLTALGCIIENVISKTGCSFHKSSLCVYFFVGLSPPNSPT